MKTVCCKHFFWSCKKDNINQSTQIGILVWDACDLNLQIIEILQSWDIFP